MSFSRSQEVMSFQSAYDLIEAELTKLEKPLLETLRSPEQLERIAGRLSTSEYLREELNSEETIELKENEEQKTSLHLELYRSFDCLTPKQLQCVRLCYWEGLTHQDAANQLGISRQAVGLHLSAAYAVIRKTMENSQAELHGMAS